MYELCTVCNRTFYVQEYPPHLCPICEEEAIRCAESAFFLKSPKNWLSRPEERIC